MKIKSGDKVEIISGKDKGKSGKILQIFPAEKKVAIEGLNLLIKNTRPRKQGEKGQQVQFPATMDISNVMLLCPKCNEKTRVGYKMADQNDDQKVKLKGKKFRQCKKCKQIID